MPALFKSFSVVLTAILDGLRQAPEGIDWFYVSPAESFGSYNPGQRRGEYRTGGDVLVVDDQGVSDISGADFGLAIVDEIETPVHRRERFTVAY